jgi:hypothetical protein
MKRKYIGGGFAANDSLKTENGSSHIWFPEKIKSLNRSYFETGVDALAGIVASCTFGERAVIYFPKHYCGDSILRFQKKISNIIVKRYENEDEIKDKQSIVIWNHFNGYCPLPIKLLSKEYTVIEDFVQSAFDLHKLFGFAAFTSLRKWCEIDCAVAYAPYINETIIEIKESEYFKFKKQFENTKFSWKQEPSEETERKYLELSANAEQNLYSAEIVAAQLSEIKKIKQVDWNKLRSLRIQNAMFLKQALRKINIKTLPNTSLFVMILIENRDIVKKKLAVFGILTPIHWMDSLQQELRAKLLSLPIDQRYGLADMAYIVEKLALINEDKNLQ